MNYFYIGLLFKGFVEDALHEVFGELLYVRSFASGARDLSLLRSEM